MHNKGFSYLSENIFLKNYNFGVAVSHKVLTINSQQPISRYQVNLYANNYSE